MLKRAANPVAKRDMLAVFRVSTDLHSDKPKWATLSFLPDHLVLSESDQYISLSSISRVWVSSGLADQMTCVAYKDKQGRTQTLVMRLQDGQGKMAGENFKALYRRITEANLTPAAFGETMKGRLQQQFRHLARKVTKRKSNLGV